jgi:hypothetical protein
MSKSQERLQLIRTLTTRLLLVLQEVHLVSRTTDQPYQFDPALQLTAVMYYDGFREDRKARKLVVALDCLLYALRDGPITEEGDAASKVTEARRANHDEELTEHFIARLDLEHGHLQLIFRDMQMRDRVNQQLQLEHVLAECGSQRSA